MKQILLILTGGLFAFNCAAQAIDTADISAAIYFNEAREASSKQKLWDAELYGPMLFVDELSRTARANIPDSAGVLKQVGNIYKGVLPKDIMIANTAITWQGKKWALIKWPLPQNKSDRLNLVMHESFHRIQTALELPASSPTINYLSTLKGRIYFLLELQALRSALSKPVNKRKSDLINVLLFRKERRLLFPEMFKNEHLLEMNEGLAEYTGVMLGRPKDSIVTHLFKKIDAAASHKSLIRSAAYITGPIYGYLLSEKAFAWSRSINADDDLSQLIQKYYHINMPNTSVNVLLLKHPELYNSAAIIKTETAKEKDHQMLISKYVDDFTKKQVLIIELVNMNITFNPDNLFDLGELGTVYPTAGIKDVWGQLEVSDGMLMKDWKQIYLAVTPNELLNQKIIQTNSWKITLNDNWKIIKADSLHYKVIREN
jgi:hypothetical protein